MHVEQLTLKNWGPYRGDHTLQLGPGVYAVIGRHDADAGRSNWIGKTWLLSAIRFVLYGTRPESAAKEDDWITRGEDDGVVGAVLSDGTEVTRSRTRGKATRTNLRIPGQKTATQKAAQAALVTHLGMDRDDYDSGLWIGQKAISQLVTMQAGDRNKLVDGWFGLAPLRAAETEAMQRVRAASRDATQARARCAALVPADGAAELPDLDVELSRVQLCEIDLKTQRERDTVAVEWDRHESLAGDYDKIAATGIAAKAEYDAVDLPDQEAADEQLKVTLDVYRDTAAATNRLAGHIEGLRDEVCPLSQAPCPVADEVTATCLGRRDELQTARRAEDDAETAQLKAARDVNVAERASRAHARTAEYLDQLRADIDAVTPSRDYIDAHPDRPSAGDVQGANAALVNARHDLSSAETLHRVAEQQAAQQQAAHDQAEAAEARARTWAMAARIIRGARREVAERALKGIESGANAVIADSGIDLSLVLRWEREGNVLTPACLECGEPISGQKHKTCPACEAPRAKHMIEELEPVLSDRSGAADDIAGLALQLAAASWLRSRRHSELATVCVDEPFGSLDTSNRTALASHLHTMLTGRYAFDQAFVVAHDARIMEALPQRIVIRYDGANSRLEVQ